MKKDLKTRVSIIRSMDNIMRNLNDEEKILVWLEFGVPDGEITESTTDEDLFWLARDDEKFAELMFWFIKIMRTVPTIKGVCVDGICSKPQEVNWE